MKQSSQLLKRIILVQALMSAVLLLHAQQADSLRLEMEGVVFTAEKRTGAIAKSAAGTTKLELERLAAAPRLFGSSDPLRIAQSLPGVSTNSEIDGGIHILGCESAHSLIRIGSAPIYGSNHLLGLFSTFIPSHFSTMEISTDASLRNRLGGEVCLDTPDTIRTRRPYLSLDAGLFFSQATADISTSKRSSLRLSARSSYLNTLFSNYLKLGGSELDYGFTDANLSWTFKKDKTHLYKTDLYYGHDKAAIDADGYNIPLSFGWSNMAASQRFINTERGEQGLYFSQYSASINPGIENGMRAIQHYLRSLGYRAQFTVYKDDNSSAFLGFEGQLHRYALWDDESLTSLEGSLFQSWTRHWDDFTLNLNLAESLFYDLNKCYPELSPSICLSYDFHRFGRLALNAGRKAQNINRTGVSEIGFPTEFFLCSNSARPPQHSDYLTLDYNIAVFGGRYTFSTQAYMKKLDGQLLFKGTISDYFNAGFAENPKFISCTRGLNYGLTALLIKNSGKLTGWAAYSFGRALRDGNIPSSHERIHEFNLVLNYDGKLWDCGAVFVLAGGTPFTAPKSFFIISDLPVANYGEINSSRLPAYSRLDLSFNWYFLREASKTFGINASLYNALGYNNIIAYRPDVAKEHFVFNPISFALKFMPSVSLFYRFQ